MSEDRNQRSHDRLLTSLERTNKIKSTRQNADSILQERRQATLTTMERKHKQENDREARNFEEKYQAEMLKKQRENSYEDKLRKARAEQEAMVNEQIRI